MRLGSIWAVNPRCHIGHPCTEAEERIGFFDNIVSGSQAEAALIDADIVGVVFGNTRLSADGCSDRVAAFFEQLHQTFTESESADFHADENCRFLTAFSISAASLTASLRASGLLTSADFGLFGKGWRQS